MSDSAVMPQPVAGGRPASGPRLDHGMHLGGVVAFLAVLVAGLGYAVVSLITDMNAVGEAPLAYGAFALLGLALLIALAFEFVNGFHDTANAVATVIYTHSMPPLVAVVWSGFFNFLGVMLSSGAVAYAIVTLLPVELILHVGSGAGYAMIFALLLAAIIWNLGTWAFGLPNSSSHALIGSVLGVGLGNQLMSGGTGTAGVDWGQALNVFKALLFSPVCGFVLAAALLLVLKFLVRRKDLYEAPKGEAPPPIWIRGMLILTCTLVSFFHGGNDGQKGMGLIMLILIGAAPTAYALNRTMSDDTTPAFIEASTSASQVFAARAAGAPQPDAVQARRTVTDALKTKNLNQPPVYAALSALATDIAASVKNYGAIRTVPAAQTENMRSDMYLAADAVRLLPGAGVEFSDPEKATLKTYTGLLNNGTRYIPGWVKVCVALALGLGTMVGWKRIVVTVGEKIGKTHLTYAQGASAEIVAAGTIGLAELYGLPVSTTHILSSGVAGTMAANGSGLQMSTVRNMALAWVLTLPAAITLAASLYFLLRHVF
ncbi:phosphate transporter [Methylobacterium sp. GXF4]|uniref:inorganic phosphate transporter n=1 Tax=Methylobacterium TaxID=407 RepID=UPI0002697F7C|nr:MULTISPECIES: inorganic phosphate transporter [Methylobacterium]AYO84926.1 inorganic phosphate transporter [Methylobacterium brachiatum]EIZ85989.1 phosphate transporter [Methylobacterium sp. GXF4]MDF2600238.1 inorganic phosphate transporter [Methylobacterium brachiatum]